MHNHLQGGPAASVAPHATVRGGGRAGPQRRVALAHVARRTALPAAAFDCDRQQSQRGVERVLLDLTRPAFQTTDKVRSLWLPSRHASR